MIMSILGGDEGMGDPSGETQVQSSVEHPLRLDHKLNHSPMIGVWEQIVY